MKNQEQKLEYFLLEQGRDKVINFQEVYGNSNPIHIEIGCGLGEFIAEKSQQYPNINYLGFELKMKRVLKILKKLEEEAQPNVRLIRLYVDKEITKWIPKNSIDRIYIMYPDPWPKRRHHKHRLIREAFLDALYGILKPGGLIRVITDHEGYAGWINRKFATRPVYEKVSNDIFKEEHIETYFERIKRQEGYEPIFINHIKK